MKKILSILTALCLLCAMSAATADMEIPTFDSMPGVIMEDDTTTVNEAGFEGEWVLNVAFADDTYVSEETLAGTYDFNFMPFVIGNGKITQDRQQANGEFVTVEMPYTFEAGQLQGQDANGRNMVVEQLEDGNLVMSVFFPGEGEQVVCLSVFLKHPEAV